jgi:L-ribulokinase
LGSAIHAAVAAGAYPDVAAAAAVMGRSQKGVYQPIEENVSAYNQLFAEYTTLHDYFGRGANPVMKRLRELRRQAVARDSPDAAADGHTGSVGGGAFEVEAGAREEAAHQ